MAAESIILERPCKLQQPNKMWLDGMLQVQGTQLFWVAGEGGQTREFPLASYTGQKRAKDKPMLMFMGAAPMVVQFSNLEDTDAISKAVAEVTLRPATAAAGSSGPAAPAAPAAATTSDASTKAAATPAAAAGSSRGSSPAIATTAAAGPRSRAASPSVAAAAAGGTASQPQQQPQQQGMPSAAERRQLLGSDELLRAQYEKLVKGGTLTEEDFWRSQVVARSSGRDAVTAGAAVVQRRGPSNQLPDVLKALRKLNEGQVMLQVTPELKQQIFAEKPRVARAFAEQVPHNMSEQEFWQRYFRFCRDKHRAREKEARQLRDMQGPPAGDEAGNAAADTQQAEEDPLFAAGPDGDAAVLKGRKRRFNPAVDLDSQADDVMMAGYGLAHNAARSEMDTVRGYKALSRALARDYNTHAVTVLKASGIQVSADAAAASAAVASSTIAAAKADGDSVAAADATEDEVKRMYENMGVVLEDLRKPLQQQFEELQVTDPRTYFHHSTTTSSQPPGKSGQQQQQQHQAELKPQSALQQLQSVDPHHLADPPVQPSVAHQVTVELVGLVAGDELGDGGTRVSLAPGDVLPAAKLDDLRKQAMIVNEVMRHFWALIPVNTEPKRNKFARLEACMEATCADLNQLQDTSAPQERVALQRLLRPIRDQLEHALTAASQIKRALAQQNSKGIVRPPAVPAAAKAAVR